MFGLGRREIVTAALVTALVLLPGASASGQQFGSNLQATPNAGLCPVPSGSSRETSCTFTQQTLADGHAVPGGVQPQELDRGVITGFRVASGVPTPGTETVKVRLRQLGIHHGFALTGGLPFVDLPLTPGIHEFPTSFPILGLSLGLDTVVTGAPGEAAAPIGHTESGVGTLDKWVPSLPDSTDPFPTPAQENGELLFNVVVEPDRDNDGYGDKTQDQCPEDPRRQAHCDRRPPRTKLTYARRQNFLGSKKVVVHVRSNETGEIQASGQIEIPGPSVTWGIYSDHKRLGKGDKVTLVLRVPAQAREHAARSFAHGRSVFAKVFVSAVDRFGNRSRLVVARVKP
jgi:hypothetical protein